MEKLSQPFLLKPKERIELDLNEARDFQYLRGFGKRFSGVRVYFGKWRGND
jgi:hypothetical protein